MVEQPQAEEPDRPRMATSTEEPIVAPDPTSVDVTQLIHEHHRRLYGYAYRLAGNDADAEDLTQQTFMIAQQKIHQLRDPAKARGWLYTVLRSCFLKNYRKRTPTPASSMELEVDHIPEAAAGDEHVDRQLLQIAVNELPDEFKLVVVMFYYEQCSYKEIADKLELPIGTVMSRLSRGKSRLRQRLLSSEEPNGSTHR